MGEQRFEQVLERCLGEVAGSGDVEAVLQRHPGQADRLRPLLEVASATTHTYADVPEPPGELAGGRRRLLKQAARHRARARATADRIPEKARWPTRRLALATRLISVLVAVAIGAAGFTGVVHAADGAAPGDALYALDRARERLRIRLAADPKAAVRLQLAFADERLGEAERLAGVGDDENLWEALDGYGEAISDIARRLGSAEGFDREALRPLLTEAHSRHERRLARVFCAPAGDDDGTECESCVGVEPHPVAQKLSEITYTLNAASVYTVSYTQVMTWFCDGYGFGEIKNALARGEEAGWAAGDLLEEKAAGGWGKVWQELGLIGRPELAGPPDQAGPADDAEPSGDKGPPDDGGPPHHRGRRDQPGPPEHAGPPDQAGPADDAESSGDKGPPDDGGPPDHRGRRDQPGPPEHAGPPDHGGPADGVEPSGDKGPPDDGGPPKHAGPPGGPPGQK